MVSHPYQDEYQREISEPLEGTSIPYKGVLNVEPGNHVDTAPLIDNVWWYAVVRSCRKSLDPTRLATVIRAPHSCGWQVVTLYG